MVGVNVDVEVLDGVSVGVKVFVGVCEGVSVDVISATISLQPSALDSLATVDLAVRMVAKSRADHELALDRVTLEEPSANFAKDLALASFVPFWIHDGESTEVRLTNAGTTNAELASLCNQTASLVLYINYLDTISGTKSEGTWSVAPVMIICQ